MIASPTFLPIDFGVVLHERLGGVLWVLDDAKTDHAEAGVGWPSACAVAVAAFEGEGEVSGEKVGGGERGWEAGLGVDLQLGEEGGLNLGPEVGFESHLIGGLH